ncbi:MAG: hypothetical protein ABIO80_08005 [Sphingomicrobium sp.]
MPSRRPENHGSFGDHFDDLLKHFRNEPAEPLQASGKRGKRPTGNVHDQLFESARTNVPSRPKHP